MDDDEGTTAEELHRAVERAAQSAERAVDASDRLLERLRRDRLRCVECRLAWSDEPAARFRAYLTGDDVDDVVLLCPDCAGREFGT